MSHVNHFKWDELNLGEVIESRVERKKEYLSRALSPWGSITVQIVFMFDLFGFSYFLYIQIANLLFCLVKSNSLKQLLVEWESDLDSLL